MAEKPELPISVLHVASEMAPLIKTGGLGDVAGALPKVLRGHGADARVLMPAWPGVLDAADGCGYLRSRAAGDISVALDWRVYTAKVWKAVCGGLPVYILEQPELFNSERIYPDSTAPRAALPFIFLSLAAFELTRTIGWTPRLYHTHDWQTAALPAAMRWHRRYARDTGKIGSVFTIHNIAYQGIFDPSGVEDWGFHPQAYSQLDPESMEFYGGLNLMKGALTTSDAITTVSPRYSREILLPEYGFGLDGVIRSRQNALTGILNGIDRDVWNPETDRLIAGNYSADIPAGKMECRKAMFEKFAWKDDGRPVLAFVGRLTEQKGIDIMLGALEKLPAEKAHVVMVGSGDDYYNGKLSAFAARRKGSVHVITDFSEEGAHMVYAGSDIFLMPSRFEPCGLSQMIACAYGSVPVVRATGGLADTVFDADRDTAGNGFVFTDCTPDALLGAIHRAINAFYEPECWGRIVRNAMTKDFSWEASAAEYMKLYRSMLAL